MAQFTTSQFASKASFTRSQSQSQSAAAAAEQGLPDLQRRLRTLRSSRSHSQEDRTPLLDFSCDP
ncbi:hypothetical protein TWF481_000821 [Arthrobotrys musiformis]|uniref:Uncharacterized protein n=1 Tax=Arthrobotrys musiformis TaxID=47236 RepID=A0AAV9WQR4_9PEZI